MTPPDATRHEVDRCSKKSRSGVDETELVRQVPHVEHPIEAQLGSVIPVLDVGCSSSQSAPGRTPLRWLFCAFEEPFGPAAKLVQEIQGSIDNIQFSTKAGLGGLRTAHRWTRCA